MLLFTFYILQSKFINNLLLIKPIDFTSANAVIYPVFSITT
jgi:hypothetical protein